ncbi:MAG: radical SAM protein [Elusimicrobiota bacterium]
MSERIDLKVGFRCNNFCKFCVQGDKRELLPSKPEAELFRSLEEGRRDGADDVVITGGEPTLHARLFAVAARAKSLGFRTIQVQTNGRTFCYGDFVKRLAEAGVNEFSPSLHGSTARIHDWLTGSPGAFLQTVSGIRNIKKLGLRVITNSVVTKANYRDLPSLARLLVSLGVDQFQFAFMHMAGRAGENKEWLTARMSIAGPWVKKALDVGIAAGRTVMTEAIPYCLMSGYEDFIAERIIPRTRIYDADSVIADYTKARLDEGKTRGPLCATCARSGVCEGPWREYPELFGWDEFVPIRDDPRSRKRPPARESEQGPRAS